MPAPNAQRPLRHFPSGAARFHDDAVSLSNTGRPARSSPSHLPSTTSRAPLQYKVQNAGGVLDDDGHGFALTIERNFGEDAQPRGSREQFPFAAKTNKAPSVGRRQSSIPRGAVSNLHLLLTNIMNGGDWGRGSSSPKALASRFFLAWRRYPSPRSAAARRTTRCSSEP